MEPTADLDTLKKSLVGVTEFYTLLEYSSWGVIYRIFRSHAGAVSEALNPGFASPDVISGYLHTVTNRVCTN